MLSRVAAGGTALDPEVVTQLLGASRRNDGLAALTVRERDVLALMAEGRPNAAIAGILVVSEQPARPRSPSRPGIFRHGCQAEPQLLLILARQP